MLGFVTIMLCVAVVWLEIQLSFDDSNWDYSDPNHPDYTPPPPIQVWGRVVGVYGASKHPLPYAEIAIRDYSSFSSDWYYPGFSFRREAIDRYGNFKINVWPGRWKHRIIVSMPGCYTTDFTVGSTLWLFEIDCYSQFDVSQHIERMEDLRRDETVPKQKY